METYDEFAIGWNEIFDQDANAELVQSAGVAPFISRTDTSRSMVSRGPRKAMGPGVGDGTMNMLNSSGTVNMAYGSTMASEAPPAVNSKKPPVYLRLPGGKRSAIDKGMKEKLMDCPMSRMRKPAAVMDSQLDQLRNDVGKAHRQKRHEARQNRRLHRRCRVKEGEDLDELEERYRGTSVLESMFPDPVDSARCAREPPGQTARVPLAKHFFMGLGQRQMSPRIPASPRDQTSVAVVVTAASSALPGEGGAMSKPKADVTLVPSRRASQNL